MKTKQKIGLGVILAAFVIVLAGWYLHDHTIAVLQPAGQIGTKERDLIIFCSAISATIVIPVFGLLGFIAWKYREGNTRAKYSPDLDGNRKMETVWWLVPTVLLVIISVANWQSSYALDPFKPLKSDKATMHIQVVALDWKWLFIYPDQQIASVNEAAIPVGTPVDFEITSDSVMTSFWVPRLGGQMYAMPGMSTQLNLIADKQGDYKGSAANISGKGFADMTFTVKAVSDSGFDAWQTRVIQNPLTLTGPRYVALKQPGVNKSPVYYSAVTQNLYDTIIMKYMMPMGNTSLPTDGAAI